MVFYAACPSCGETHYITFNIAADMQVITKIGHYPEPINPEFLALRENADIFDIDDQDDIVNAVAAHINGLYAGAFLYFRRIYERKVDSLLLNYPDALEKATRKKKNLSFKEKLSILEDNDVNLFPKQYDEVKGRIYHFISEGIHAWNNIKCKDYYDFVYDYIIDLIKFEKEAQNIMIKAKEINEVLAKEGK